MSETSDTRAPRRYTSARGLDRLVFFTDAIAAIAITLLILPLVDLVAEVTPGTSPGAFLGEHAPELVSFVLSFAVIARLWFAHHQLFEHVRSYSFPLVLIDIVWAFTIVLLPLPTAMINRFQSEPLVIAFYIGTMAVSAAALTAMALILNRSPALQEPEYPVGPEAIGGLSASALLFVVALIVGTAVPAVSYWALTVMFLTGVVGDVLTRALRRREASQSGD